MNRFQFVADHQHAFEVKRLCRAVCVARSSYYAWQAGHAARQARAEADADLAARIRTLHAADNTLGAPRITAELNDQAQTASTRPAEHEPGIEPGGGRVNHKRVARVMRAFEIRGYRKRRRVRTTVAEPSDQPVADLLGRNFTAPAPNQCYVGDITYLPLADGTNLYLATVIDCYSRRLVGWSIADHMRTSLVVDALRHAALTRGHATTGLAGAVFHSDHGSVYTSRVYAQVCADLGVTQSMGRAGTSADNALAESFNATVKRETLQDATTWPDELTCRRQLFRWLVRYNTHRRHSWCHNQPPATYEAQHATTLSTAA